MKTNLLVALSTATLLFSCNDSISEPPSPVRRTVSYTNHHDSP